MSLFSANRKAFALIALASISVLGAHASDRYLLINGVDSSTIARHDFQTGTTVMFIDVRPQGGRNNAFTISKNGNILVAADNGGGKVLEYSGITGAFVRTVVSGLDALPHGIAEDSSGNILVGSAVANTIKKYNGLTGAFMQTVVSSGQLGLRGTRDMRFDRAGNLFYVGAQSDSIYKIPSNGSPINFGALGPDASSIDFGFDGNVYGVALFSPTVKVRSSSGVSLPDIAGGLSRPRGIAFNDWGGVQRMYVSEEFGGNFVKVFTPSGTLLSSFSTSSVGVSRLSFMRTYTPVPEPGSILALSAGLVALARSRRRR